MTSEKPLSGKPKASLQRRTIKAGGWTLLSTIANFGLRLVSNLIMTRLLVPEAFGMIAMASLAMTAMALFTDIGIGRSITREKDGDTTHFLRVAWVVKILRSVVIAAGILVAAVAIWLLGPVLAPATSVYAQPEMPGLIAIVALTPVLLGFTSTAWELTSRHLAYHRYVPLTIGAQLCSIGAMVLFAWISPTVWALAMGMLVNNILLCVLSHLLLPGPRMKFEWDPEIVARLWNFGKWILGSSMLSFAAHNADKLILGGLLGATTFGIYTISQVWVGAGKDFITRISDGVGFPAVAEVIRTRPADIPRVYRKYQTVIDGLCITAFLGACLLGEIIIGYLYTTDYHQAGRYLQLASVGFLMMRFDTLASLVLNTGNSRAVMHLSAIRAVSTCLLTPAGFYLGGVEGAIMAVSLSPVFAAAYVIRLVRDIIGARQSHIDTAFLGATLAISALVFYAL